MEEFANVSNELLRYHMSWDQHTKKYEMGETNCMYEGEKRGLQYFGRKSRKKMLLWIIRRSWEDNIQTDRTVIVWEGAYRIHLDDDKGQ